MSKITGNEASQTFAELKSPPRRLFVKGVVGLGAAFASSSLLSAAVSAQDHSRRQAPPGNEISPAQGGWGPFTPSAAPICERGGRPWRRLCLFIPLIRGGLRSGSFSPAGPPWQRNFS